MPTCLIEANLLYKGQFKGQSARTDQLEVLSESAKLSTDISKLTFRKEINQLATKTNFPLL